MANISGMIAGLKQKYRDRGTRKAQAAAQSLAALKAERIRAEGQKKIYDIQAQERARLAAAKASVKQARFENSFLGKAQAVGKKLQSNIEANKKSGSGSQSRGLGFGGNPDHFALGGASTHPLFADKKASSTKEKKKKQIIINV